MKRHPKAPAFPAAAAVAVGPATTGVARTPLAHQGGWDEILMVAAPLAVIGLLLWIANRRVSAQIAAAEVDGDETGRDRAEDVRISPDGADGNR